MTYTYMLRGLMEMTSRTDTMERVKELRAEARQAERGLKVAHKLARAGIDIKEISDDLSGKQADALGEARELKPLARLEDLSVYRVEKKGKKGKTMNTGTRAGGTAKRYAMQLLPGELQETGQGTGIAESDEA
jgi:hypothetical protein